MDFNDETNIDLDFALGFPSVFDFPAIDQIETGIAASLSFPCSDFNTPVSMFEHQSLGIQNTSTDVPHHRPRAPSQNMNNVTKKRAPKAPTMTSKKWKPCEARIKELYVRQCKSFKELQEIVNKEFNLCATERQYKVQIQRMKLERNAKEAEQMKLMRYIRDRQRAGKNTRLVRIRGHPVTAQRLARWMLAAESKGDTVLPLHTYPDPPSPLPSCISIFTKSDPEQLDTGIDMPPTVDTISPVFHRDKSRLLLQRLISFSEIQDTITSPLQIRDIIHDIQQILGSGRLEWDFKAFSCFDHSYRCDPWDPNVEGKITHMRNLMNSFPDFAIGRSPESSLVKGSSVRGFMTQCPPETPLSMVPQQRVRFTAWRSPYGWIYASFKAPQTKSELKNIAATASRMENKSFGGRVVIVPNDPCILSSGIIFDFESITQPTKFWTNLTFFNIIPNSSTVFDIIRKGEVDQLIAMLESKQASLNDRDERGRSFLSYAMEHHNEQMCKFFVGANADISAIEASKFGVPCPVFIHGWRLTAECSEEDQQGHDRCLKIMLDTGADCLAELGEDWNHEFYLMVSLRSDPMVTFRKVFYHETSVMNLSPQYQSVCLMFVAEHVGYELGGNMHILEKTVFLLKRNFDVCCLDSSGNTLLHAIIACERSHESESARHSEKWIRLWSWKLSISTPKDMLILAMSAGADIFAINEDGLTPHELSARLGRSAEWEDALIVCGYDVEWVTSHSHSSRMECMSDHPTSKLSFEQCCQQFEARKYPPEGSFYDHLWKDVDVGICGACGCGTNSAGEVIDPRDKDVFEISDDEVSQMDEDNHEEFIEYGSETEDEE